MSMCDAGGGGIRRTVARPNQQEIEHSRRVSLHSSDARRRRHRRCRMIGSVLLAVLARSYNPISGHTHYTGPATRAGAGGGSNCSVQIVRRFSHPFVCWPKGDTPEHDDPSLTRDTFYCEDDSSVTVTGECWGLFLCGNGATTECFGGHKKSKCYW